MRAQATGAGRTLSVSSAYKVKEHQCRLAAARTVVLLLSSLVFFQLHGPRCGNACPQTSKCCNLLWHDAGGPDACRCRLHCANNDPVRETLLAPKFPRQYGVLGPGAAMRHSSMKSQGEATMTQAQGSHSTLN
ncbi:hypothetical protein TcCL_ESM02853 [Trypanosoma cruzi]|nr:hypothetical protein TcCL_ESM02853 [Trypanosoma cruzi]